MLDINTEYMRLNTRFPALSGWNIDSKKNPTYRS
jgi:hypothetical protein